MAGAPLYIRHGDVELWHQRPAANRKLRSNLEAISGAMYEIECAGYEVAAATLDAYAGAMLEGWTAGSQAELAGVLGKEAASNPDEKKLLLDKRNRNWVPQIEGMMLSKQTIFITVGAAHLVGPGSVLDAMCLRGWKVERIKTGASAPPPACPMLKFPPSAALVALRR